MNNRSTPASNPDEVGPTGVSPTQQYPDGPHYTHGYQDLGPHPIDTGYSSSGHPVKNISRATSDSGYATRTPSVASSLPQQSYSIQGDSVQGDAVSVQGDAVSVQDDAVQGYPIHSYPVQGYPAQSYPVRSYSGSRQQGASYSYGNQPSHDIELVHLPVFSAKHKKDRRQSTPPLSSPSGFHCLHPNCGHICSRAHDLKRHMMKHFPPPVDELLDCRYEWCGRTGAYGFKRDDHRKEHYRKVHTKESEYPKTGEGSRSERDFWGRPDISAPPATYIPVVPENEKNPVQTKATEGERTVEAYRLPTSGNSQIPGLSTEAVAQLESQQPTKIHETLPVREIVGLKASVPDSDVVRSTASDAHNVRPIEWSTKSTDDVEKEPPKGEKLDSCSDNRSVHEQSEHGIFDGYGTRAKWEYPSPSQTISDGDKTVFTPITQPSIKDEPVFIKDQVLKAVAMDQLGRYCASLKVEWDVMAFMEDQFHNDDFRNTMLGPVVTISGSVQHAEATTCSEYIRQHWPAHGSRVLDALQDALKSPSRTSRSRFSTCNDDGSVSGDAAPCSRAELEFDITQKCVCLNIKSGSPDVIVDIIQQLEWMGAALRTSVDGRVNYCVPKLAEASKAKGIEPTVLKITFEMSSPGEEDQSCWFSLFKNPVIAHRFPTTLRNDHQMGLEITLDMMAALGGARHAVDFEGGLVLKGYSTLFVPIKRQEDSVQWHLICARGEDRIAYSEASARCPNRVLLNDLNHEELKTTRAFLGWWKEAEIHLATADADYENIDWSKAKEAGTSPRLTGGTLGVSKIFSAQVSFVLGAKDGPYHYSQQEPFQKTIDRADRLPIVLYDQKDRKAWLVPALPVILHIIQLRNHMKPFVVGGSKVQISPLDPSRQGHAAKEAVARNKSQKLFDCETHEEKDYCFRDAILDTWSILDRLMEREATTQATPGMAVHSTWQDMLYGWEFKAVADEDRHLKQKVQVLETTAGRWYDLVKDVDAVVLFASGFGDIIKPSSELAGLCRNWRRLQRDKDYLAVCVPMLENFYAKAGHRQDQHYLTSAKLQWHRKKGSMLFEQCADTASDCCKCDRLQQVYRDSYKTFGHRIPPGNLEPNGCVVFGQANHSMKRVTKPPAKSGSLYTQSNDNIHSAAVSRSSSSPENCTATPNLVSYFNPYYNKKDRTRTPSPDPPLPPLKRSNWYRRKRRLPHPKIATSDGTRNLDEPIQRVSSATGRKIHAEQEGSTPMRDSNESVMELKRTRRPIKVPNGANYRFRGLNRFKLRLYKWLIVGSAPKPVHTTN